VPFRICKLSAESLHKGKELKKLEKVQIRATKIVITVKRLRYMGRLVRLNLPTLKYRRIQGDMIEVYKILTNRYDIDVNLHLQQLQSTVTRGHN